MLVPTLKLLLRAVILRCFIITVGQMSRALISQVNYQTSLLDSQICRTLSRQLVICLIIMDLMHVRLQYRISRTPIICIYWATRLSGVSILLLTMKQIKSC